MESTGEIIPPDTETSTGGGSSGMYNMQNMHFHHPKIDVIKFDGEINFVMWRCEVMDALFTQWLIDTIENDATPAGMDEDVWIFRNRMACAVIRSCLTQDIKYNVMTATSTK